MDQRGEGTFFWAGGDVPRGHGAVQGGDTVPGRGRRGLDAAAGRRGFAGEVGAGGFGRAPSGLRRGYVFLTLFHIRQTGRPGLVSAVFSGALRGGFGESTCF